MMAITLILAFLLLVSGWCELLMRFRLANNDPESGFTWWRCSSLRVVRSYDEAFPGSFMPTFGRFALGFLLVCAVALVIYMYNHAGASAIRGTR